jgi:hydrogenase expression/formation protein HypC
MCLAVPAKIIECDGSQAVADLQGNTLRISTTLTPDVTPGDWVLIHAGFSITKLDEAEARQTWDYLRLALGDDADSLLRAEPDEERSP